MTEGLVEVALGLNVRLAPLRFGWPVTHVYNPLTYAWGPHKDYLTRFGAAPKEVLFLGMNPGPWGMAQTGVPFGEVALVRDWLEVKGKIGRPDPEHPKRPIQGFDCTRSEVSGARLWGWIRKRFRTPERFFSRFFIANYCPLVFMEESGRNRTPDKLSARERDSLLAACDEALARICEILRLRWAIGVGTFAEKRLRIALAGRDIRIGRILHPSPASPEANRGWAEQAERALRDLGIRIP